MSDELSGSQENPTFTSGLGDADLLAAVRTLSVRVEALTASLTIQRSVAKRWRWLTFAVVVLVVVVSGAGLTNYNSIGNSVDTNKSNAVQSCENANNVREANVLLWSTVLGFNAADTNLEMRAAVASLLAWITDLYQPRDCADLGREYIVPPPPDLSEFFKPDVSGNSGD